MTNNSSSITGVTRGPADATVPADGEKFRYGNGFPFQAGPHTAGVFLNLRFEGFPVGDFEAGMDVILFDDLDAISTESATQITRSEYSDHPVTGKPRVTVKHSQRGGFVPFGALREDGTPHSAAGRGFLLGQALNFPSYGDGYYKKTDKTKDMTRAMELSHLAYDGATFSVVAQELFPADKEPLRIPASDWKVSSMGLKNAIPDGDDLLFAVEATEADPNACGPAEHVVGLSRWQLRDERWRPVSFVPVARTIPVENPVVVYDEAQSVHPIEPSVIRDMDGSLLFTARWCYREFEEHMVRIWRSADDGESWNELFTIPEAKSQSPVSINTAADGTPYVASCPPGHERDILMLRTLDASRTGLEEPVLVRNGIDDFGEPPSGKVWFMDHPNGTVARLADGEWHGLLSYRVLDRGEHGGADPTPFTGHYLEEVLSTGSAQPPWRFE